MLHVNKPDPRGVKKVRNYMLDHLGWIVITATVLFREELRKLLGLP